MYKEQEVYRSVPVVTILNTEEMHRQSNGKVLSMQRHNRVPLFQQHEEFISPKAVLVFTIGLMLIGAAVIGVQFRGGNDWAFSRAAHHQR